MGRRIYKLEETLKNGRMHRTTSLGWVCPRLPLTFLSDECGAPLDTNEDNVQTSQQYLSCLGIVVARLEPLVPRATRGSQRQARRWSDTTSTTFRVDLSERLPIFWKRPRGVSKPETSPHILVQA